MRYTLSAGFYLEMAYGKHCERIEVADSASFCVPAKEKETL
jgi:hypothetical protein